MSITSIILKHTNPSMGPHETVTTVRLGVEEKHRSTVADFLETSMVNQVVTMKEYLNAIHQNQTDIITKVEENSTTDRLPSGSNISHLTFHFAEKASITLHDVYRRFSVSNFYPTFTKYMVENGTISKDKPFDLGSPSYLEPKEDILHKPSTNKDQSNDD